MSKPYIHAQSSARQFGGVPEDYIAIHNWFDATKAVLPDNRHRALRHHAEGIFLCESIFGVTITNSDGRKVSVRDVGEQHVLEDFGGRFIPTAQDYLQEIEFQDWMENGKGEPPSHAKIVERRRKKESPEPMVIDGGMRPSPEAMSKVLDGFRGPLIPDSKTYDGGPPKTFGPATDDGLPLKYRTLITD